jgi:phage-related protein
MSCIGLLGSTEVIVTKHTRNVYTNNKKSDDPPNPGAGQKLVPLVFQGDSRRVLQGFPEGAKSDLGYALYRLQLGQTPPDRKAVQAVGPGVHELREADARAWYRVLYAKRTKVIQVLHCFEKRTNAIEQKDIETARARLKRVLEAEREEKKNAQQALHRK